MNMSTAYLLAGWLMSLLGLHAGTLALTVGGYYVLAYAASTLLVNAGFWWYAFFAGLDFALACVLGFGFGMYAKIAAGILITSSVISLYAGREGGFLYSYYGGIGGALNTLFLFFVLFQVAATAGWIK